MTKSVDVSKFMLLIRVKNNHAHLAHNGVISEIFGNVWDKYDFDVLNMMHEVYKVTPNITALESKQYSSQMQAINASCEWTQGNRHKLKLAYSTALENAVSEIEKALGEQKSSALRYHLVNAMKIAKFIQPYSKSSFLDYATSASQLLEKVELKTLETFATKVSEWSGFAYFDDYNNICLELIEKHAAENMTSAERYINKTNFKRALKCAILARRLLEISGSTSTEKVKRLNTIIHQSTWEAEIRGLCFQELYLACKSLEILNLKDGNKYLNSARSKIKIYQDVIGLNDESKIEQLQSKYSQSLLDAQYKLDSQKINKIKKLVTQAREVSNTHNHLALIPQKKIRYYNEALGLIKKITDSSRIAETNASQEALKILIQVAKEEVAKAIIHTSVAIAERQLMNGNILLALDNYQLAINNYKTLNDSKVKTSAIRKLQTKVYAIQESYGALLIHQSTRPGAIISSVISLACKNGILKEKYVSYITDNLKPYLMERWENLENSDEKELVQTLVNTLQPMLKKASWFGFYTTPTLTVREDSKDNIIAQLTSAINNFIENNPADFYHSFMDL